MSIIRQFAIFGILFLTNIVWAQNPNKYTSEISEAKLKEYLTILTSDSLAGRGTGEEGQKKAANFIANHFKKNGLSGPINGEYFQKFELMNKKWGEVYMKMEDRKLDFGKDFYCFGQLNVPEEIKLKVVFAGFGIQHENYNDFEKVNVKNKAVIILMGDPLDSEGNSLITKSKKVSEWANDWKKKCKAALEHGAKQVFFVTVNSDVEFNKKVETLKHHLEKPKMGFHVSVKKSEGAFFLKPTIAAEMLQVSVDQLLSLKKYYGIQKLPFKLKSKKIFLKAQSIETPVKTENVLGCIEGTDLKNELVVITAHYDHLGVQEGKIFRGADDDGTGVITLMTLSEAFMKAKKEGFGPRRSVLFIAFTGEEHGLLGSEYYSEYPVFELKNTVADLNIDMTGRLDAEHSKDSNYVYVIGSDKLSNELKLIGEEANNQCCGLILDYRFDAPDDPNKFYYRSDHYNFAKHNVPVIFYFNGVHEDYHKETDTIDKIIFSKVAKIASLVFTTSWELVNRNERIKLK